MTQELFLGDPYATREAAVQKMLDLIGRDTSDLTFTPNGGTDGADLPSGDPDVTMAWNALSEVYAEVMSEFWSFNTVKLEISPNGSGNYVLPNAEGNNHDTAYFGGTTSGVAVARVIDQPSELNLIYRDEPGTSAQPRLFDRLTNAYGDFTGKGNVTVEVAHFLLWTHLPLPARYYIVMEAALRLSKRAVTSETIVRLSQNDVDHARVALERYELEQDPPDVFEDGLVFIRDRFPF